MGQSVSEIMSTMLCKLAILALVPLALASQNQYLRKSLFDHYDKLVKPDNGVKLDFRPTILNLNLCPRKDVLTVDSWLRFAWNDSRLAWNEDQWNGIKQLSVPWRELWIPDIGIYTGLKELEFNMPDNMNRALIMSDGSILWIPQVTFMSGCVAKAKDSVQSCVVKIGPWTESKQSLEMVASEKTAELEYLNTGMLWKMEMLNATLKEVEKKYDCCEEMYQHVEMELTFKYKDGEEMH